MLNTRREVCKSVASGLISLERSIDDAIVQQGIVQAAVVEGRRKAKLPLDAGQDGIALIADASVALVAARKAVHEAHIRLREVQDRMGVGVVAFGDYGDTPRVYTTAEDVAPASLTLVAAA